MLTMTMKNPSSAYTKVGIETGVASASPHRLILMLYEGALVAVSSAIRSLRDEDTLAKGQFISKAISIIDDGLKASLDYQGGGDLSEQLAALYDYMCMRLLHANLTNSEAALLEVSRLLGELKGAWEEIADDPAVLSSNKAAA